MQKFKIGATVAALAATMMVGSTFSASAQMMMKKKPMARHGYSARVNEKPLTIAKPAAAPSPFGVATAPIGFAGQIVTAPLSGLSQAFGYGALGGPSKPLPIVAKYEGAGAVSDSISQGWAQPVPVSANGPIYKLEPVENSGGASPFALIAAPITAATTIAESPFNAAGYLVGAAPPPPPVF